MRNDDNEKSKMKWDKYSIGVVKVCNVICLIGGVIASLLTLIVLPVTILFLPIAALFWFLYVDSKRELMGRKVKKETFVFVKPETSEPVKAPVAAQIQKPAPVIKSVSLDKQKQEPTPKPTHELEIIDEAQIEKMIKMCEDIKRESSVLWKKYRDLDMDEYERKCWIIKECWRKLDVVSETQSKYGIDVMDVFDESEKIGKKARSFINAYMKWEREENLEEECNIDIAQFYNDLDFISEYLDAKQEKIDKAFDKMLNT